MKVVWREQAKSDFREAIEYLRKRNPSAALRTSRTIHQKVRQLTAQPGLGRPGRVPDTRELVVTGTPYIVAYSVDKSAQAVIILQVQHSARLWPESFDEDDDKS